METHQNPQFVGMADARNPKSADIPKGVEFTLSPEQQQIIDVMKKSGKMSRYQLGKAIEKAGKQLQQLHGKELVNAGLKKIGLGLGIGWATENAGALVMKRFGDKLVNRVGPQIDKAWQDLPNHLSEVFPGVDPLEMQAAIGEFNHSIYVGGMENLTDVFIAANEGIAPSIGKFGGGELTSPIYRLLTRKASLPKLRWYEFVVGQFGSFFRSSTTLRIKKFELNLVNPVTVSGFLNVAKGLYELGQERLTPKQVSQEQT